MFRTLPQAIHNMFITGMDMLLLLITLESSEQSVEPHFWQSILKFFPLIISPRKHDTKSTTSLPSYMVSSSESVKNVLIGINLTK